FYPAPVLVFSTGGDMLDFLVQSGEIGEHDGLLATWFHRANSKEAMNQALASDVMILEADVTLEGFGTANQKPVPIMAHPPDIYSDNTLDQWLEAVLDSKKGIKLDFKSLESVGFSLELLKEKSSSRGINRPVWLNADILRGPNVPSFLIQENFPNVTLSPGWMVCILNCQMNLQNLKIVHVGYKFKLCFPRFSLTLWQGSVHPSISDLLFVRDNTQPAEVYYDIYEPTLSEFKEAASKEQAGTQNVSRVGQYL
uniref:Protein FAM151A n=1 Tax=Fundulus heteroclitus TaxID=8078 RepID=A0A3Q2U590_FUNHE